MDSQNSSISNFKKFVLHILLPLLLIIAVAGYAIGYFFEKEIIFTNQLCGSYKVNRIIKETYPAEVPIFGSSRAEGSFIPDSLGKDFFNYGLSGTKLDVLLFFLKEECKKKKRQPYIIIALDFDSLQRVTGDIANYIPNANYMPVKLLLGDNYKPYFNLPMLKYYGRFDQYIKLYLNNKIQLTKVSNKGAAIEKNTFSKEYFKEWVEIRQQAPVSFVIDPSLKQTLIEVIRLHPERFFIFVATPYHSSFFKSLTNYAAVETFIHQFNNMNNVKVFDFSQLPLPDSLYLNTSHLNYDGVKVFNPIFKDSLSKLLKTHTH